MVTKLNDFTVDLEHSLNDESFDKFYLHAFPMAESVETILFNENPAIQRRGIDKVVHFKNGNKITIDEKMRRIDYGDILLELYHQGESTGGRKKMGWLYKNHCDYIAYLVEPTGKVYLLPLLLLQMAYKRNRGLWEKLYPTRKAENKGYTTFSISIPARVLLDAIKGELSQRLAEEGTREEAAGHGFL